MIHTFVLLLYQIQGTLTPTRLGFLKVLFSRGQFDSPFIFQEELIQYHYSFIQWLNNLYKVGWRKKNADIVCYMLTPLVYLQQGNNKKTEIEEVKNVPFGNVKNQKKPGFYPLSRKRSFGENTVWGLNWPPNLYRVKISCNLV